MISFLPASCQRSHTSREMSVNDTGPSNRVCVSSDGGGAAAAAAVSCGRRYPSEKEERRAEKTKKAYHSRNRHEQQQQQLPRLRDVLLLMGHSSHRVLQWRRRRKKEIGRKKIWVGDWAILNDSMGFKQFDIVRNVAIERSPTPDLSYSAATATRRVLRAERMPIEQKHVCCWLAAINNNH